MKVIRRLKKQVGESLLEVTISLGLALLVVTALTVTTVNGLKNSQLSQNQLKATKYAQEGIERIRQIRERNCPVNLGSNSYVWYGPGSSIWGATFSGEILRFTINARECKLDQSTTPEPLDDGKFTRTVSMTEGPTNTKKVTVSVNWTDFSGNHESKLETSLTNN